MKIKAALLALVLMLVGVPNAEAANSIIADSPTPCVSTNGDVVAMDVGPGWLAFGGNFTSVNTATGAKAAKNLAVIDTATCKLLYAGNANNYVRAVKGVNGRLYVGGDFTMLDGKSRNHLASLNVGSWAVNAYNPGSNTPVRSLSADAANVYSITYSTVKKTDQVSGANRWSRTLSGGVGKAVWYSPDYARVFIGGTFETAQGHGMAALNPADGSLLPGFVSTLDPDTPNCVGTFGDCSEYSGIAALSFAQDYWTGLVLMGGGGAYNNISFEFNPYTGERLWTSEHQAEGDVQAVAALPGGYQFQGYHRNHSGWHTVNTPAFCDIYTIAGDLLNWPCTRWDWTDADGRASAANAGGGTETAIYDAVRCELWAGGAFKTPSRSLIRWKVNC